MADRKKIAVLGTGLGSLSTVFGITSQPDWQKYYEITVYQEGWRMGGKCASSRDPATANRIEEHGLHIFFGFYDNAIKMMREAYKEIDRPLTAPMATFEAAFKPHSFIAVEEYVKDKWVDWPIFLPPNDLTPGSDKNYTQDMLDTPMGMIVWVLESIVKNIKNNENLKIYSSPCEKNVTEKLTRYVGEFFGEHHSVDDLVILVEHALSHLAKANENDVRKLEELEVIVTAILEGAIALLEQLFGPTAGTPQSVRQLFEAIRFGFYVAKGIVADLLFKDWEVIDDLDFRQWLGQHGAPESVRCSAIIRSFYDLYLAYPCGDTTNSLCGGNVAAGTLLHAYYLSLAQYKGAIFWKMQAGMGESVVVPLYQALQKRGVKFEFFNRVSELTLTGNKQNIASINIDIQATLKDPGKGYEALIPVKNLPCWPKNPLYEQLVQGKQLQEQDINLESPWSPWQPVSTRTLSYGEDFDLVVLGISIGGLKMITEELSIASPAWKTMLDNVQSTQTQAMQLWLKPNLEETGWKMASVVLDAYEDPFNTWADMSQTIDKETWPQNHLPFSVAYFCNNLDQPDPVPPFSDHTYPAVEKAKVKQNALNWLSKNTGQIWPYISNENGGLNWNQLVDMQDREGITRFDGQYWHAAINPSERYVLSVAGSTKYRLKTNSTGFGNLFITGDWVNNGFLNIGCVESTVVAGFRASQAISGYPKRIFYVGGVD